MFLYQIFQSFDSLKAASALSQNNCTQGSLIAQIIKQREEATMRALSGETDALTIQRYREEKIHQITSEVRVLSQRGEEIRTAISAGVSVIIGIYGAGAFLRDEDGQLVSIPENTQGTYVLRAAIPGKFQSVPALPQGLLPYITDRKEVDWWPSHILPTYMKRNIECFPQMTLNEVVQYLKKNWRYPFFLKTLTKNVAREIHSQKDIEDFSAAVKENPDFNTSTGYIISETMTIAEDARGKREFRAYVVGGKVINISRNIIDTGTENDSSQERIVPAEVHDFCRSFANDHAESTMKSYVLDIAECQDGSLSVVELNDIRYSGRFIDNEFNSILKAIRNSR